jgi:mono/diheme cytochrome c family protein
LSILSLERTALLSIPILAILALVLVSGAADPVAAQGRDLSNPAGVYEAACATCHGDDGSGAPAERVGFDVPLPDFTDCSFASREPAADWFAVTHAGGPVRGFARNMPAFGDALTGAQIEMALAHVYAFCDDDAWPRGELNLPRPMITEKAYPEDEAVWTSSVDAEGPGAVINELLYEKRFGSRNQIEVKLPFGFRESGAGGWSAGIGDLTVGLKRALAHSLDGGYIFSAGAEVVLPTGDAGSGFGKDTVIFEPFAAAGFLLPRDSFVHLQAGAELSTDTGTADHEAFYRGAVGMTFAQGPNGFGRAWTPMLEVLATTELGELETETALDLLPQVQVTLNTRQHVMVNVGVRVPVNEAASRDTQVLFYLLWDWFDGGFFDGW